MSKQVEERSIQISVSNIEDAIASFLIATSVVARNEDIINIDLPIENKNGIVDIKLTVLPLERN